MNSSIHQALGSQGVITNGTVRDLPEVRQIGFPFLASEVQVPHGFAHLEDFNRPVKIFRMTVEPGDLIHADQHGIVVIPVEVADRVAEAARDIERQKRPMIAACRLPDRIEALDELVAPEC